MTELTTTFKHLLVRQEGRDSFVTHPTDRLNLTFDGIEQQKGKHYGRTAIAGVRDEGFTRTGPYRPQLFNHRQISIIDEASLTAIADGLEVDGDVTDKYFGETPELFVARHMGANIVTALFTDQDGNTLGLHDLEPVYYVGPTYSTGLLASSIMVMAYNDPCAGPGKAMADALPSLGEGVGRKFIEVARARRGFVGVVGSVGGFLVGDTAKVVMLPRVPQAEA